ncbi:MAG TPA: SDR family NAD(P)-dependent oxidoreductase [Acidimicrobiales bacterium]|nr:SDR family NAD(P)-dependent oxidoreductase [Acidimicrobiales bacterium]
MKTFQSRVGAVTGGGSGIGRAVATELARRGAEVALCDVDEAGLAETAAQISSTGTRVSTQRVDVADRRAVEEWADKVAADHGKVNLIVNNAGVALGANVETMSYEDLEWLMGVNFWGVVHGTKAFLPHLRAAGEGHIVNISSVFGMVGIPSQSAYNAAKFAVRGFTEALRLELDADGGKVSCTTIHPGGIKTNIARNGRFDDATMSELGQDADKLIEATERAFRTTPEKAAQVILDAVQADKRRAFIGADAQMFKLMAMLPPGVYQNAIRLGTRLGARLAR